MEKIAQAKLKGRIKHSTTVKGLDCKEGTELHKFHQKDCSSRGSDRKLGHCAIAVTQRSF